jgi:hypothetical protein
MESTDFAHFFMKSILLLNYVLVVSTQIAWNAIIIKQMVHSFAMFVTKDIMY